MKIGDSVENGRHGHGHGPNRFGVLPVALRLGALESATGRGVTIAFLDSGFVEHPDLTRLESRIVAFHDVESPGARLQQREPHPADWHGTQTSSSRFAGRTLLTIYILLTLRFLDHLKERLAYRQTHVIAEDLAAAAALLRRARAELVSPGIVEEPKGELGFHKGFLVRNPDGQLFQMTER